MSLFFQKSESLKEQGFIDFFIILSISEVIDQGSVLDLQAFIHPFSLDDVLEFLERGASISNVMAGGTDLFLQVKQGLVKPKYLVSLAGLKELKKIDLEVGFIKIGSVVAFQEIIDSEDLKYKAYILQGASRKMGFPQLHHVATIGGNLGNASPAADSAPPLIVLRAKIRVVSKNGERVIPVESFFLGIKKTVLKANEIIKEVVIPLPGENFTGGFVKLGKRNAHVLSTISVAVGIQFSDGIVKDIRIGMGFVAPIPLRTLKAENVLRGKKPAEGLVIKCAKVAASETAPISDQRASTGYRWEMVFVLTRMNDFKDHFQGG